jgi:hypothetical protein
MDCVGLVCPYVVWGNMPHPPGGLVALGTPTRECLASRGGTVLELAGPGSGAAEREKGAAHADRAGNQAGFLMEYNTVPPHTLATSSLPRFFPFRLRRYLPPMSCAVDDLVASFSANHIGQEAIELAAFKVCSRPQRLLDFS